MRSRRSFPLALLLAALGLLAACSGPVAEALSRLIEARFVPAVQTVERGSTQRVTLEIRCSDALETPFERLSVQMRVDDTTRPVGLQAVTIGTFPAYSDGVLNGYQETPCVDPTGTEGISVARVPVDVSADASMAPGTYTLRMRVQVEELPDELPKDQTYADLTVTVTAPPDGPVETGNLLADPGFEGAVAAGGLPGTPGVWQGDAAAVVAGENDVVPHGGSTMLRFVATGAVGSTNTVAGQMWQTVDLRAFTDVIGGGTARVYGSAWFNRIAAGSATDRRFDVRLIAFDGDPADVAARYAAGSWLAERNGVLDSEPFRWQWAQINLELPVNTTYVLFEIYAFEDVQNDADGAEFAGHYADDASLVLVRP